MCLAANLLLGAGAADREPNDGPAHVRGRRRSRIRADCGEEGDGEIEAAVATEVVRPGMECEELRTYLRSV